MKYHHTLSLILSVSVASVALGADRSVASLCARPTLDCLQDTSGLVIGEKGAVAGYKNSLQNAAHKFERFFGRKAPAASVILGTSLNDHEKDMLKARYPIVLPWLTPADKEKMIEGAIRKQVKHQKPELDDAAVEAIVQRSLKASREANGLADKADDMHDGVLSHELGHLYFINKFWPEYHVDVTGSGNSKNSEDSEQYAGPAPDWLDEVAAVLMESDSLNAQRRAGFKRLFKEKGADAFWPLQEFFSMTHPALEQAKAVIKERQKTAEGRAKGNVVIMQSSKHEKAEGKTGIAFYLQSRALADFMIEKSGDETLFADIAAAIAGGKSIQDWLAYKGQRYHLGATVNQLEKAFYQWAAKSL